MVLPQHFYIFFENIFSCWHMGVNSGVTQGLVLRLFFSLYLLAQRDHTHVSNREKDPNFLTTQSSTTIYLDFFVKEKWTSLFKPVLFGSACCSLQLNLIQTDAMIQPNSQWRKERSNKEGNMGQRLEFTKNALNIYYI